MPIFLVVPTADLAVASVGAAVEQKMGPNALRLPRGEWLVFYEGTSQDLSNVLQITDGTSGTALVTSISGYYGRAPTNVWEWIRTRWK